MIQGKSMEARASQTETYQSRIEPTRTLPLSIVEEMPRAMKLKCCNAKLISLVDKLQYEEP